MFYSTDPWSQKVLFYRNLGHQMGRDCQAAAGRSPALREAEPPDRCLHQVDAGSAGRRQAQRWPRHLDGLQRTQVDDRRQERPHLPGLDRSADRVPQQAVQHQCAARLGEVYFINIFFFYPDATSRCTSV